MFYTLRLLLLPAVLLLAGCGSFLAYMESNAIEDEPGERTLARQLEDESIETKAIVNIHDCDEAFDDAHFDIISHNGYVLLVGQVPSERLKALATQEVRQLKGVRRLYNELEIAAPSSLITRTSDTWITSKIKAKLLASRSVQGLRVKVVTEDGSVFLLGLLTEEEQQRALDKTASVSGVQRVVNLFETID